MNGTNNPCSLSDLDFLYLVAIQKWASVLQRTSQVDHDIISHAAWGALKLYESWKSRLEFDITRPTLEQAREAIETWATWKALELREIYKDDMTSVMELNSMPLFIQELKEILKQVIAPSVDC